MSRPFQTMVASLLIWGLSSCQVLTGPDGTDGVVYLSFTWEEKPETYTDTNPAVNGFPRFETPVQSQVGRYEFEYRFSDGSGWAGYYELLEAEEGGDGKFFRKKGKKGRDSRYEMALSRDGSGLTNTLSKRKENGRLIRVVAWPVSNE
jgi:hypothetical protein